MVTMAISIQGKLEINSFDNMRSCEGQGQSKVLSWRRNAFNFIIYMMCNVTTLHAPAGQIPLIKETHP